MKSPFYAKQILVMEKNIFGFQLRFMSIRTFKTVRFIDPFEIIKARSCTKLDVPNESEFSISLNRSHAANYITINEWYH